MQLVCKYYRKQNWLQIIYITGEKNYHKVKKNLKFVEAHSHIKFSYLHNMEWAYAVADLVISRAGATGLAEITAKGIPAILIPYPHASGESSGI